MSEKAGIKLSTKTWHYKLIKYVLGSEAPTPENMHNLCPYFWLMIFSMFAAPFKFFFGVIGTILEYSFKWTINLVDYMLIEPSASGWFNGLDDRDIYNLYNHDSKVPKLYTKSKQGKTKSGYDKSRKHIINDWFKKVYKKSIYELDKSGKETNYQTDFFTDWRNEQKLRKNARDREIELLLAERRANRTIKIEEVGEQIGDTFTSVFHTMGEWKNIIKWTKRVVGAMITTGGLTLVYFIVNFIGRGMLWIVENFNGPVVLENATIVGGVLLGLAIAAGIFYILRLWVLYVAEQGVKLWYVKIVYYPIYWLIFLPMKFIFVDLLWDFLVINLAKGIVAGSTAVWFGFLGFFGIFGEYFGASYTDYCPGIEWEENKEVEDPAIVKK